MNIVNYLFSRGAAAAFSSEINLLGSAKYSSTMEPNLNFCVGAAEPLEMFFPPLWTGRGFLL